MEDTIIIAGSILLIVVVFTMIILTKLEKIEKKINERKVITKIISEPTLKEIKVKARVSSSSKESSSEEHPLYGKCEYCGKTVYMPYRCTYCGKLFCDDHRLPFNHDCEGMDSYRATKPPGGGRITYKKK